MKYLANLDLNGNEIQNVRIQNLSVAPPNPKEGQPYFNTTDKILYVYANGEWKNALYVYTGETFTAELKAKLNGIASGATKVAKSSTNGNVVINGNETEVYKHPGSGTNPHGTTKSDVGLGNVENKSVKDILAGVTLQLISERLGFTPKQIKVGADSGKGTAEGSGILYIATDTKKIYLDNASGSWLQVGGQDTIEWGKVTGKPSTYTPPVATASKLGGIKVGKNLKVASDGTLDAVTSASDGTDIYIVKQQVFSASSGQTDFTITNGEYRNGAGLLAVFLDGIKVRKEAITETGNTSFRLSKGVPEGTQVLAEYVQIMDADPYLSHGSEHVEGGADAIPNATTVAGGLMSNEDKTHVDNLYKRISGYAVTAGTTSAYTANIPGATLAPGTMIALRFNASNASSATLNLNGLGAKPIYYKGSAVSASRCPANAVMILVYDVTQVTTGAWHLVYSYDSNTTYTLATASKSGLLSTNDFSKLAKVTLEEMGFLSGVTSDIQNQLDGKAKSNHGYHVPDPGTSNNGKILQAGNTAGSMSWVSPSKSMVGLSNVPNVATNDQTPTYTAASTLSALVSGEKLSVAFGKIAKAVSELISHISNKSNPHGVTKSQVGLGNVDNTSDANKPVSTAQQTALDKKLDKTLKGAANGLAELDSTGKVPAAQLPSFVDDVIDGYLSSGKFYKESEHTTEITGESGKIYVDLASGKTYRWSGSAFAVISDTIALGETASTAYRGDRGKIAYDHSQKTSGNPHGVTKSDVGLGNVPNVATNDQTPTYTEASSISALTSGEKMSVAMGKIAKAISSLISHLNDTTKHITASERTSWNSRTKKYAANIGNGSATEITVTHNLGTQDITVMVRETASPYNQVFCDTQVLSTTQIKLLFASAPASGAYRVIVTG